MDKINKFMKDVEEELRVCEIPGTVKFSQKCFNEGINAARGAMQRVAASMKEDTTNKKSQHAFYTGDAICYMWLNEEGQAQAITRHQLERKCTRKIREKGKFGISPEVLAVEVFDRLKDNADPGKVCDEILKRV